MKIAALFIQIYLVQGPSYACHLEDLMWCWKVFAVETGVQPPENWLRDFVLDYGVVLEEPAKGKSWRGWRVRGLALNPEMARRHALARNERMGILNGGTERRTE